MEKMTIGPLAIHEVQSLLNQLVERGVEFKVRRKPDQLSPEPVNPFGLKTHVNTNFIELEKSDFEKHQDLFSEMGISPSSLNEKDQLGQRPSSGSRSESINSFFALLLIFITFYLVNHFWVQDQNEILKNTFYILWLLSILASFFRTKKRTAKRLS